jgi:hypothetical protein
MSGEEQRVGSAPAFGAARIHGRLLSLQAQQLSDHRHNNPIYAAEEGAIAGLERAARHTTAGRTVTRCPCGWTGYNPGHCPQCTRRTR